MKIGRGVLYRLWFPPLRAMFGFKSFHPNTGQAQKDSPVGEAERKTQVSLPHGPRHGVHLSGARMQSRSPNVLHLQR
jgi:hypothetical protein